MVVMQILFRKILFSSQNDQFFTLLFLIQIKKRENEPANYGQTFLISKNAHLRFFISINLGGAIWGTRDIQAFQE